MTLGEAISKMIADAKKDGSWDKHAPVNSPEFIEKLNREYDEWWENLKKETK